MLSCLLFSLSFIGLTCLSFILRNGPVSCVAIYKLAANLIEKVFSVKIDKKINPATGAVEAENPDFIKKSKQAEFINLSSKNL